MGIVCRMPILPISVLGAFFGKSFAEIYSPNYANKILYYINITKYTADNEILLLHILCINFLIPIKFLHVFDFITKIF